jgi:hypothetical protein
VFAVLAVALLLTMMPDRVRVLPVWIPGVLGIVLIMPMAAVMLSRQKERWLPIERTITLVFCVAVGSGMIAGLALLIAEMVRRSGEVSVSSFSRQALRYGFLTCSRSHSCTGSLIAAALKPARTRRDRDRTGSFRKKALPVTCRQIGGRRLSTICSLDTRPRPRSVRRMSCH